MISSFTGKFSWRKQSGPTLLFPAAIINHQAFLSEKTVELHYNSKEIITRILSSTNYHMDFRKRKKCGTWSCNSIIISLFNVVFSQRDCTQRSSIFFQQFSKILNEWQENNGKPWARVKTNAELRMFAEAAALLKRLHVLMIYSLHFFKPANRFIFLSHYAPDI